MRRPRVFVTRRLLQGGQELVLEHCEADIWPDETPPSHADLIAGATGKDGLLSFLTDKIDSEVIAAAPELKVISNCAVGVDDIDLLAAAARRIPVGNTPDVLTDATADLTFALLLAAARRIVEAASFVKAGKWKTWSLDELLGADFAGRTLGIVGFGRIGQAVARRASGFGLRVIYCDPEENQEKLGIRVHMSELLRDSDFISLHVPLTAATRHMINKDVLDKMRPGAILINTARGPVVDHDALYDALAAKRILAAALDVTEPEPLASDSPLLGLPNCIVVPHLGSASVQTRARMSLLAAENLIAGVQGRRLPHCVNLEIYE